MTIINLDDYRKKKVVIRYRRGDICRALCLALEDASSPPAQDIEEAFSGLIFERDEHAADGAREVLCSLLEAYK